MDIISFNEASTANGRIESFIENPDSTSGVLTVPKTIAAGETITIPAGRVAILPDLQVDGDLVVDGDLFIPTGSMTSQVVQKVTSTDNAVVRFDGTTGQVQNSAITIDDSGNIGSGTQSFNGFGGSGFKNYIINGNFNVWQRGTSFVNTTTSSMSLDGNFATSVTPSGTCTISKDSITYSGTVYNALKAVANNIGVSSTFYTHHTMLEGSNVHTLRNKPFVISFLIDVSHAGNYNINIRKYNASDVATKTFAKLVSLVAGVNKVEILVPADSGEIQSNVSKGLTILIAGQTNTSITSVEGWQDGNFSSITGARRWWETDGAYVKIAQVQLEEGSIATPFENRPYGLELSLCQRYYEKIDSNRCNIPVYGTGTGFLGSVKYKVPKRTVPTISLGTASHWRTIIIYTGVALSTLNVQETTAYGFDVNGTSSGGNITAGYAGKIQVSDGYTDNGTDGIFVSAEL